MPNPLEALAWGSRSTRSVRRSETANEAARLTAVVVLPTPPFWLATAKTRQRGGILISPGGLGGGTLSSYHRPRRAVHRAAGNPERACRAAARNLIGDGAPGLEPGWGRRLGALGRPREREPPTRSDPGTHPGHGLVGAGERLSDRHLVWLCGERLDPPAAWLGVHEAERAHGSPLEVMTPLSGLDERHARTRPADRERKAREARATAEIHERSGRVNREGASQGEGVEDEAASNGLRGAVPGEVHAGRPLRKELGEGTEGPSKGRIEVQLAQACSEERLNRAARNGVRGRGRFVFHVERPIPGGRRVPRGTRVAPLTVARPLSSQEADATPGRRSWRRAASRVPRGTPRRE